MDALPIASPDTTANLVILILSLLCVTFFTSSEAVLISVSKIRVRHLAEQGRGAALAIQRLLGRQDRFFATVVLTQNLFIILATSIGTALAISLLGEEGVPVATVVMTVLVVVFGEMTPKTLAVQASERYALLVSRPIEAIMWLLTPVTFLMVQVPRLLSRLLGGRAIAPPFVTEDELHMLISIGAREGTVEESEEEMLHRVFQFGDRVAQEVMTPRPDIVWLDANDTLADFLPIYAQAPHSRFPIYRESIDDVIGVLSIKDVLMAQARGELTPSRPLASLARPAYFVPASKRLGPLFNEMQSQDIQMAVVVDEFGGTAGILTLEQLMEEVMGEVGDELARTTKAFEAIDERTVQIEGSMRIDEANEELGLGLPEGNYETVAGFVLSSLGHIPREGEQLSHKGLHLVITEMDGIRIAKVLVTRFEDRPPLDDEAPAGGPRPRQESRR